MREYVCLCVCLLARWPHRCVSVRKLLSRQAFNPVTRHIVREVILVLRALRVSTSPQIVNSGILQLYSIVISQLRLNSCVTDFLCMINDVWVYNNLRIYKKHVSG